MKRYVLTGGPCVGKTTLIKILRNRGYTVLPEAARAVIEEERHKPEGVLPGTNLQKFQQLVASRQFEMEETTSGDFIFLDRSLIDGCVYCLIGNVSVPALVLEHGHNRYDKIFLLSPLPVFMNDETRTEDFEEALRVHHLLAVAYRNFGYRPINVPVLPPEDRADFILGTLKIYQNLTLSKDSP